MDEGFTLSLLKRAKDNGFGVLVIPLDTWSLAWRLADLDNAYVFFITGIGNEIGFTDPVFRAKDEKDFGSKVRRRYRRRLEIMDFADIHPVLRILGIRLLFCVRIGMVPCFSTAIKAGMTHNLP
ncbi:uncharacterized protein BP01DRAFT_356829 [Aspergillus saccharolyticus JOP 1030-1]|uniref:Uncharacterized protein n=1 Tax=Aspergillus saccharolyticus JOP 1030-1 TaxID=1450539 RepID=A0A318ZDB6_9EURO|nr:hypothetical protein BP01DRAFT_356829 [Aspergillus saccharolyticus JOP 1030-1]PYH45335.1 hypothetical protein BP01DRAFT_356829 [Aspergillus saccharolyticus JOP 1030-1]